MYIEVEKDLEYMVSTQQQILFAPDQPPEHAAWAVARIVHLAYL